MLSAGTGAVSKSLSPRLETASSAHRRGPEFAGSSEQGRHTGEKGLTIRISIGCRVPREAVAPGRSDGDGDGQWHPPPLVRASGSRCAVGRGTFAGSAEAVEWFRKAAAQDYADAQFNLGFMYANGKGVPQSPFEAVRLYREAANKGHAGAQLFLGVAYALGIGVERDAVRAHMWISLSVDAGHPGAPEHLATLEKRLKKTQISEVRRLKQQWQESHS